MDVGPGINNLVNLTEWPVRSCGPAIRFLYSFLHQGSTLNQGRTLNLLLFNYSKQLYAYSFVLSINIGLSRLYGTEIWVHRSLPSVLLSKRNSTHLSMHLRRQGYRTDLVNSVNGTFPVGLFHDQLPLAVPCYDLLPVTELTVGRHKDGRRVLPAPLS